MSNIQNSVILCNCFLRENSWKISLYGNKLQFF